MKITDKMRLDFLTEKGRDGFTSLGWEATDFGELRRAATQPPGKVFSDPRQAIDAAIRQQKRVRRGGR